MVGQWRSRQRLGEVVAVKDSYRDDRCLDFGFEPGMSFEKREVNRHQDFGRDGQRVNWRGSWERKCRDCWRQDDQCH